MVDFSNPVIVAAVITVLGTIIAAFIMRPRK